MPSLVELAYTEAPGSVPARYTLPAGQEFRVSSVSALFNGAAAGESFMPCLAVYSQNGVLIGRFPADTVAAGDSAEVTFGPFLRGQQSSGSAFFVAECGLHTNGVINIPNATVTDVTWGIEYSDNDSMWGPGTPTIITAQTAGAYTINVWVEWDANATGYRYVDAYLIGTGILAADSRMAVTSAGVTTEQTLTTINWSASVGSQIKIRLAQDSGGARVAFAQIGVARYTT